MISPELLRRYPIFAGLSHDQLVVLAQHAQEIEVESGYTFFTEGQKLNHFYLVVQGRVAITTGVTDQRANHSLTDQITGNLKIIPVTITTVGNGEFFGWSALIPPPTASAGAQAVKASTLVAFDGEALLQEFEDDPLLGYRVTLKLAQVVRQRLRDLRVELVASIIERDHKEPVA